MKLTWITVCCALFTVAPVYAGESAELPFGASLPAMLVWLDQHHPEIQAMQQESLAAMARVTPAGALPGWGPDPSLVRLGMVGDAPRRTTPGYGVPARPEGR